MEEEQAVDVIATAQATDNSQQQAHDDEDEEMTPVPINDDTAPMDTTDSQPVNAIEQQQV